MNDYDKISLAFDILESAEIMHEFENEYWVKIDKESFNALFDNAEIKND